MELDSITADFLKALEQSDFQGDIEDSYGARIVASTDNSVYQVLPQAILYPCVASDINSIVALLAKQMASLKPDQTGLSIVARGGGTGTNGQSLNQSLVLDTSRYLNKIISLDKDACQVVVEPGVVLDQLNVYLAPHGLFFPPDVSSSSRATLGGMVATDASGKGSRIYGKTSDYIEAMDVVLSDGTDFCVKALPVSKLDSKNTIVKQAQKKVYEVVNENKEEIKQIFPEMNRGLTGYNLEHIIKDDQFRLSYLLAGSEGTLALNKRLTLRVIAKPKKRALVVVLYKEFERTLDHIALLLKAEPTAIEVLDDKILQLAQQDAIWQDVQSSFSGVSASDEIKGLNFIEVTGDSDNEIKQQCEKLDKIIQKTSTEFGVITSLVKTHKPVINGLWGIRKRAVGLLGGLEGERRPMAFVEDTAVPPASLPDFIKDFKSILEAHGLDYGMYGHADVGCLHVRPALNMREESDQKLLRTITDQIANLTKQYGGLLWGEHGRGYRGEYSPLFFGEKLYPILREIKGVFDPNNLFNPGKLATPAMSNAKVTAIDEAPFRGAFDAQINLQLAKKYDSALQCNGNGACFSWDVSDAMCPSYKATRDKRYSPKGRAAMLREWLRLSTIKGAKLATLEEELYDSLKACLSCKSCTHSCPIKVDIPELKSQFLESYHQHKKRQSSDYLFTSFESIASVGRAMPKLANALVNNRLSKKLLGSVFRIVNTPKFSDSLKKGLQQRQAEFINLEGLSKDQYQKSTDNKTVILLPDSFNASYDSQVLLASYDVLMALGYRVLVAPVFQNGKAQHVKGFRNQFRKVANQHVAQMNKLAKIGLPLISTEVVTRLMHGKEYADVVNNHQSLTYKVWSIESWLINEIKESPKLMKNFAKLGNSTESYKLLPHCMEQTLDKQSAQYWQKLFDAFGGSLKIENAGCCGMSGLFGHEKENQKMAESIFQLNWKEKTKGESLVLASGFSCRCQLHNHRQGVKHPIEILALLTIL